METQNLREYNRIGITIEGLENFSPFSVDRNWFEKKLNFLKENQIKIDENLLKIISCHILINEVISQTVGKNANLEQAKTSFEGLKKLFELLEKTYNSNIINRNDQMRNLKYRIQGLEKKFSQN